MRKFWPFSLYFLYYAALAYFAPFIVLFYQDIHFSGPQIALLTGIPPLITLFAGPFWTNVADSRRWHRQVMSLGIVVAIVSALLLQFMSIFTYALITVIILFFFFSPVVSLSDSATIAMLGADKAMYGRVRIGGTIGWGLFALIAGAMINNYGLKLAFWGFAFFSLINLFIAQKLTYDEATGHGSLSGGGVRFFLTSRRWPLFLVSSFLGGLGAFSVASFLAPYMAGLGANESQIGFAIMIATLTELPVFLFGNRLLRRFAAQKLFFLVQGLEQLLGFDKTVRVRDQAEFIRPAAQHIGEHLGEILRGTRSAHADSGHWVHAALA